jgi:hypothetical protein
MQLFFVIGIFFLPLVLCDTINVNSPTRNQIINNSSFLIDYLVERSGNLFITNTTTDLLDVTGNSLVSFPKNLSDSTVVRLDMRTFVQSNTVTNFTVKIVAFGKYNTPVNGQLFGEIKTEVPLQLNLSNNSTVTSRPTSNSTTTSISTTTSKPTSTSNSTTTSISTTTSKPTSTSNSTTTSQPSPTTSSSSGYMNGSEFAVGLTSFLALFLI